jgi:fructokinase
MSSPSPFRLGLDLGGTKIAALIFGQDDRVVWEERIGTPRYEYVATIEAMASLVSQGDAAAGARCSVGVGMPGAISPATGLVKNANSTWLNGQRFHEDLERALARPVRLANDANCLAVSEAADGAAAGASVVFGVILGTGTGGGIVVDGRPLMGANAIAGEWGHNQLAWPSPEELPGPGCYCGRTGCIETWLSGPGLAADYTRRGGDPVPAEVVVSRAREGEAVATETLHAWTQRLSRCLANVINIVDPDVIVVGGGLSRIASLYDDVPRLWSQWVFSDHIATRLVPARHGDASGVRGAARLWPSSE